MRRRADRGGSDVGDLRRGEHLIDPWSGKPAARVASATVTGPDLGLADALATALAVAARGPRFPGADSGLRGLCHRPRRLVAVDRELPIRADRNPKKDLTRRCLDRPQACRGKTRSGPPAASVVQSVGVRALVAENLNDPEYLAGPARGRANRATAANGLGLGGRLVVGRAGCIGTRHPSSSNPRPVPAGRRGRRGTGAGSRRARRRRARAWRRRPGSRPDGRPAPPG